MTVEVIALIVAILSAAFSAYAIRYAREQAFSSSTQAASALTQADAAKQSALAAEQSVQIAQEQAVSAREQAEIARRSLEVTHVSVNAAVNAVLSAERARLDARAPSIGILIGKVSWPPIKKAVNYREGVGIPCTAGEAFRFPGAQGIMVGISLPITLKNEDSSTTELSIYGNILGHDEGGAEFIKQQEKVILARGQGKTIEVFGFLSAKQWADNVEAGRQSGLPELPNSDTIQVVYFDGFDNGVVDNLTVEISGTLLAERPEESASWYVPDSLDGEYGYPRVGATVVHRRRYYYSKSQNLELPPFGGNEQNM